MNLLMENDYRAIQRALETCRPFQCVMQMERVEYKVQVKVEPAPEVWGQPMLINVQQWRRKEPDGSWSLHLHSSQNFRSVEEMRKIMG